MQCTNCKKQKFCSVCGEKIEPKKLSKKEKAIITGGVVLVAVGGIAVSLFLVPAIQKHSAY